MLRSLKKWQATGHRWSSWILDWFKTSGYVRPLACPLTIASVKEELYDWWRPNRHALTYEGGEYVGEFFTRKASNCEIMEWLAEMLDRAVSDRFGVPADLERPWLDLITVPTNWLQTRGREEALDSLKWWRARGAERGDIPENFNTKRSLWENLAVLEWLLVRGYSVPFEVDAGAGDSLYSKRWWAEVRHRPMKVAIN
ncbi:hypothetical protein DFJ73DRAFT_765225 [Zopfochytrium polystomum]|nr:hypothetical protein DFJ73DRAFT_765225 [Zopfochytrium polystomum]